MVIPDEFHNGMIAPLQTNKLHVVYIHTHLGCPVAWLISNREDEATLTMLFKTVKVRCPNASVNTLMTDDGTAYTTVIFELCFTIMHMHRFGWGQWM